MKIFNNVKSSADKISSIEVNVDTVYIRSNIVRVDTEDFTGWQYDEVQYNKDEYVENLASTSDISGLAMILSGLMIEVDNLKQQITV